MFSFSLKKNCEIVNTPKVATSSLPQLCYFSSFQVALKGWTKTLAFPCHVKEPNVTLNPLWVGSKMEWKCQHWFIVWM